MGISQIWCGQLLDSSSIHFKDSLTCCNSCELSNPVCVEFEMNNVACNLNLASGRKSLFSVESSYNSRFIQSQVAKKCSVACKCVKKFNICFYVRACVWKYSLQKLPCTQVGWCCFAHSLLLRIWMVLLLEVQWGGKDLLLPVLSGAEDVILIHFVDMGLFFLPVKTQPNVKSMIAMVIPTKLVQWGQKDNPSSLRGGRNIWCRLPNLHLIMDDSEQFA